MSEEDVEKKIKTPSVLTAFERAKLDKLPDDVKKGYEAQDSEFDRYSFLTADIAAEAKAEGEVKGRMATAKNLLEMGMDLSVIIAATGLSKEQIESLKK